VPLFIAVHVARLCPWFPVLLYECVRFLALSPRPSGVVWTWLTSHLSSHLTSLKLSLNLSLNLSTCLFETEGGVQVDSASLKTAKTGTPHSGGGGGGGLSGGAIAGIISTSHPALCVIGTHVVRHVFHVLACLICLFAMAVDVSWLLSSLEELCVIVGATAKHVHEQLRFRHLVLYGERDGFAEDLESAEETGVDVVGFDIERELVRVGMQLGVRHLAPHCAPQSAGVCVCVCLCVCV